jgi:hypothetical protein
VGQSCFFRDTVRPHCSVLKQLGSGSVATGVVVVARDASAQFSAATTLGVEQRVLADELARLPKAGGKGGADVDLAKMYSHLVAGKAAHATMMSDTEHHRGIFSWCAHSLAAPATRDTARRRACSRAAASNPAPCPCGPTAESHKVVVTPTELLHVVCERRGCAQVRSW